MNGPLAKLAEKLKAARIPALSVLFARFEGFEEYDDFVKLVQEYTPEHEEAILRETTMPLQLSAFADRFADKYFPLHWAFSEAEFYEIASYGQLTVGIPLMVMGLDYNEMDRIITDGDAGERFRTFLVSLPENGMRTPLAEACARHVPKELLERVPEGAFSPDELRRLLGGTRFAALVTWADMIYGNTGNYFLDTDDEMYGSSGPPDWSMENVVALTTEWQQAEAAMDEINNLTVWLEQDPAKHFEELLDFILKRRREEEERGQGKRNGLSAGAAERA